MIRRRNRDGERCKTPISSVDVSVAFPDDADARHRDDAERFRMEEEMGRLLAEKDAAENRADLLERRLALLQNDFVRTSEKLLA